MPKPPALPSEAHVHFQRANRHHEQVQKRMVNAAEEALEAGKELLEAKQHVPHGRWEEECGRIFAGSIRLAESYMQFAKHMAALPKAQNSAILMLESSIDGAAKAAKKAAKPDKPKPPKGGKPKAGPTSSGKSPPPPAEDAGEETVETPPKGRASTAKPPTKLTRQQWYKQWDQAIGPIVRLVDKIADGVGEKHDPHHEACQEALNTATEEMIAWMGVNGR